MNIKCYMAVLASQSLNYRSPHSFATTGAVRKIK